MSTAVQDALDLLAPTGLDRCATCGTPVRTLRNANRQRNEDGLARVYVPPGGCLCLGPCADQEDPACPVCNPPALICQECGVL